MSVAIIVDTFPRWSERFIARELNELKRRGLEFSIYCLRAGDPACDSDPEFADLISHRVVLPACFIPSAARELGMEAAAVERKRKVEAELGLTAFRQIGCANSLVKLIREHRHTHVYAHFASLPSTLGWLASEALKLPLVLSFHARDVFVEAQVLDEKLRAARRVFICNEKAFEALRSMAGGDAVSKLTLMRHGLALESFPFQPRPTRKPESIFKLLTAGRFVKKKGFDVLIDVLASKELSATKWSLSMLGEGPEEKALKKQIAAHGLSGRVEFPGSLQGDELRGYFETADVLVVPSIQAKDGDSDGLPNVVLEAFALGLPVIGTRAGSLADALNDATAMVVEASDSAELARAILTMMKDGAGERCAAGRALVEKWYDISKNLDELVEVLRV